MVGKARKARHQLKHKGNGNAVYPKGRLSYHTSGQYLWRKVAETIRKEKKRQAKAKKASKQQ